MKTWLYLSFIFFASCAPKVWHKATILAESTRVNDSASVEDSSLIRLVDPYKQEKESKMNIVIAENETKLDKARPESPLTNWVADIIDESVKLKTGDSIDCTVMNYGSIRSNYLAKGNVTLGNVFEIMPFDNLAVVLRIKGDVVQKLCDHMSRSGGWPVSKSLHFIMAEQKATQVTIHSQPLDADRLYRVCVPDYIANGGDDCTFLKDVPQTTYRYLLRDAILDGISRITDKGMKITSSNDGRIISKK